jgi:apolipoprotein N-acyltransferase
MNTAIIIIETLSNALGSLIKILWYGFWTFTIIIWWCLSFSERRGTPTLSEAFFGTLVYMAIAYLVPKLFKLWVKLVEKL